MHTIKTKETVKQNRGTVKKHTSDGGPSRECRTKQINLYEWAGGGEIDFPGKGNLIILVA